MPKLDIFSDTICPWCYVGKRRLERALEERPQPGLEITWRTFQLNPDMPPDGMDRQTYLELKFGGPLNARATYDHVREAGRKEAIPFDFDAIQRTPNTIASHRLLRHAHRKGCQEAVVQALFDAYFVEGRNIGDFETLAVIAESAGLAKNETLAFLRGDEFLEEVRTEDALARRIGITGVPCFIFNGSHALSGAQPPEAFYQMFDLMREETPVTG